MRHPQTGSVTSISEVVSAREYRRSELYNDVYRGQGVEDQITVNLAGNAPGTWHCVAASRHRRGFSARDRERLATLRPHLITALRRASALARLRASEQRALHQLDVLAPAAITLAAWFGFDPLQTGDVLPGGLADWLGAQRRPGLLAAPGTPRQPFVQPGRDGRRLVVSLLDGTDGHGDLLVLGEHRDAVPDAGPLRGALGLSARQAEVLLWIAQGKGNADIGQILGIRLPTVKMHVTRLFETLGCETRTAAARIALETLGRGGW